MSEVDLAEHHAAPMDCTHCDQRVVVRINRHATGNLTIRCPQCGHEHFRYCQNGEITEDRWRSAAQPVPSYLYSATATSNTATAYASTTGASTFAMRIWCDSGTASW